MMIFILSCYTRFDRPLGRVVKGESGVQSHSDLDGVGSIPAIPNARYVPSLLCRERFNKASLPAALLQQYSKKYDASTNTRLYNF